VTRPGIRQALLKPAFAHLYPGIPVNEWQPAAVMTDQVLALRLRKLDQVPVTRERVLDERHFEFRGVTSSAAHESEHEARLQERRRRVTDD
jgi:hypothetical protein